MKVNGNFNFMGVETQKNEKKNETYYKLGLMQGLHSKIIYINEVDYKKYEGIAVASPVYAEIELSDRDDKTYWQLNSMRVVSTQQRNTDKAS